MFRSSRRKSVKNPIKRRLSFAPRIEALERRVVPVVNSPANIPAAVAPGTGFDGVVRVFNPNGNCSGTLLSPGRHILLAAHCVDGDVDINVPPDGINDQGDGNVDAGNYRVQFNLPGRVITHTVPAANVTVHNEWNGLINQGSDIAIIRLNELAPFAAEKRLIYRDTQEDDQQFTFLGYGGTNRTNLTVNGDCPGPVGTICSGNFGSTTDPAPYVPPPGAAGIKRQGFNVVEDTPTQPANSTNPFDQYLRFDLDSPSNGVTGEAMSAPGDSGGPLLINGFIAGVSSSSNQPCFYGSSSWYTRVSPYAGWIDNLLAKKYNLVIDMQNQLPGNDGTADTITVVTGNIPIFGERLYVSVNGVAVFNDFLGAVNRITIRGSHDVETIKLDPNNVPIRVPVTIDSRGGVDELQITPTRDNLDLIQANVKFDGGTLLGDDWVTLNDSKNAGSNRKYTITSTTVELPGGKATVTYERSGRLWLDPGTAPDATVNVYSTMAGGDTNIWAAPNIVVGGPSIFCNSGCSNTTEDIRGNLIIFNPFQKTALTIDNAGDGTPNTVNITDSEISGLTENPISYGFAQTSSVTVNGGFGGNTFLVHSTGPSNLRGPFRLNTGTGVDQTYVYNNQTDVTVNGQNSIDPSGQNLKDQIHIGANQSLATIQAMVTVTNFGNWSAVTLDDSADDTGDTVNVSNSGQYTYIKGLAPAWIRMRQRDLSALTISGGFGNNTFIINDTPLSTIPGGMTTNILTGIGDDTVNVFKTSGPVKVDAQTGANTLYVGSYSIGLNNINANVDLSGPGGVNTLLVYDSVSTTTHDYIVDKNVVQRTDKAAINYQDLSALTLTAGSAYDQFIVNDTGPTTTIFTNGVFTGSSDYVSVAKTTGAVNLYAAAQSWIDVGNNLSSLDNIQGKISILPSANNQMTVSMHDTATTASPRFGVNGTASGQTYQRTTDASSTEWRTLVEVLASPITNFEYWASSGGSYMYIDGTAPGTSSKLTGHAGALDWYAVGWAADTNKILGEVSIFGQAADHDYAYYYDYLNPNPQTYTIQTSPIFPDVLTFARSANAMVAFNGIGQVIFYAPLVGGNVVNIQGTAAQMSLGLAVGDGDVVTLGSAAPNLDGTMDNFKSYVSVGNYTYQDQVTLVLDDSGNQAAGAKQIALVESDTPLDHYEYATGLGAGVYWALGTDANVQIRTGATDDTFAMQNITFGTPISIDAGGGVNSLDYSAHNPAMPGLVSWWKGENNAVDAVGGHQGTLEGDTTFVAGKVGQALSFDGDGDYVFAWNSPSLEPTTVSVEAWVNSTTLTEFGEYNYILAKGAKGFSGASYALVTSINSGLWFYVGNGGAFGYSPDTGTGIWDGNWHHVVGTYDGTHVRLYVDGAEVGNGSEAVNFLGYGLPDSNDLYIGTYGGIAGYSFDGLIDEPAVFNKALSAEEIQKMFEAGSDGKSVLAKGVTVNLRNSTASGLAGGIAKIQNVIGSSSHDILVGNGGNVLTGGDGRDLLIAGLKASQLFGGEGEDILIGGTTSHDTNAANLKAIQDIWTSGASYNDRVNSLRGELLAAGNVFSNGVQDTLFGQGGTDFFFAGQDQFDAIEGEELVGI